MDKFSEIFNQYGQGEEEKPKKKTVISAPVTNDKPEREIAINKDDIINLKIELNTCKTIEQFLERV